MKDVADWTERYRQFWEESFDRLDEYLKELQEKEKDSDQKKALPQPGLPGTLP